MSLRPLLENPDLEWERPAFTQTLFVDVPGYSVRTKQWRFVEWGIKGEAGIELYDQESDPREMHNLAASQEHAAVIVSLKEMINRNWPNRL